MKHDRDDDDTCASNVKLRIWLAEPPFNGEETVGMFEVSCNTSNLQELSELDFSTKDTFTPSSMDTE